MLSCVATVRVGFSYLVTNSLILVREFASYSKAVCAFISGGSRGGSEVSTEPPFLAGYVINFICTVKDPGFMEPPFLPFS